jgi:FMN phosphatase YigB (HAD superfamily)/carbamoylphosphate synthase large subunit
MESKNNKIKILFTSVGRRVELIQAFREAAYKLQIDIEIYGVDAKDTAPASKFCDQFHLICQIEEDDYIPRLYDICKENRIDMVFPTIDTDLLVLSEHKEKFLEMGSYIFVSDPLYVSICRDKRMTREFFNDCGLKTPQIVTDVEEYVGEFPCFIKPIDGRLSINAFRVDTREELVGIAKRIKNYVIQPFIDGIEYTLDIFCDMQSNPIYITPRKRVKVRGGEVLKTEIIQDDIMIEEALRLIGKFKPVGPITLQLIRQIDTEDDYFIEISPRFAGGSPLSMKAGADSAAAVLSIFQGKQLSYVSKAATNHTLFARYDQSVSFNKNVERNKKIKTIYDILEVEHYTDKFEAILFDMDDTLYPERMHIQSGFKEVAKLFPEDKNAYSTLCKLFEDGEPAIDVYLEQNGIYKDDLKEKCLHVFVSHKPKLDLYPGVIPLLMRLKEHGKILGLITDGRGTPQSNKIEALYIKEFFDEIIITDELAGNASPFAFRKPNVLTFEIMKTRLGIPYSKMVYVGDNKKKDFIAPNKLGMESIHFSNTDGICYDIERFTDRE